VSPAKIAATQGWEAMAETMREPAVAAPAPAPVPGAEGMPTLLVAAPPLPLGAPGKPEEVRAD